MATQQDLSEDLAVLMQRFVVLYSTNLCSIIMFYFQLRHFFVMNEVHFGVYAINHISPDEEITMSFDFAPEKWYELI